jgi:hypothetical protein
MLIIISNTVFLCLSLFQIKKRFKDKAPPKKTTATVNNSNLNKDVGGTTTVFVGHVSGGAQLHTMSPQGSDDEGSDDDEEYGSGRRSDG